MGAYSSNFSPDESKVIPDSFKPTSPDWIIAHVDACGVPILKVQRCWHRFLQLGANRNGNLTPKSKIWTTEKDKFLQQVLRQLPWNDKGILTFQVFLNACSWFESASIETKVKVIFGLMNRGKPVTADLLQRVLAHVYPSKDQAGLELLAENMVKQIDGKEQGFFDEEDFLKWVKKTPLSDIENFLKFEILPNEVLFPESTTP